MQNISLFQTCLVQFMRPQVSDAARDLVESTGSLCRVPANQTCCGQVNFNAGDLDGARLLGKRIVDTFLIHEMDALLVPSASCAGMIRLHLPRLLEQDPEYATRARSLAERTWELFLYLKRGLSWDGPTKAGPFVSPKVDDDGKRIRRIKHGIVTYHHSCSALRDWGIREEPESYLRNLPGVEYAPLSSPEVCCGFGGAFCVKFPKVSAKIADKKIEDIRETGAQAVLSSDLGCLLHLWGRISRGSKSFWPIRKPSLRQPIVRHLAEFLADGLPQKGTNEERANPKMLGKTLSNFGKPKAQPDSSAHSTTGRSSVEGPLGASRNGAVST